jgi:hypothetical protein
MEQAVGLLHKAKEAAGEEKVALLDRLLTLVRGISAAPTFLDELLPLVLELRSDEDARPFVAQVVFATPHVSSGLRQHHGRVGADAVACVCAPH